MKNIHVVDHPLITHKLTLMRRKETSSKDFREMVKELSTLMAYEVTRSFPLKEIEIETPIAPTVQKILDLEDTVIVPILRAGLGMVEGFTHVIPNAKIGHIGLFRDPETLTAVEYFCKLPKEMDKRTAIITDPMLATGVSAIHAIDILKREGCTNIRLVVILTCPRGIEAVNRAHPDVEIYCADIDPELNDHAYLVPGLGDAGDRLFGTL